MMAGSDCGRTGQWRPPDGIAPGGPFRRARASRSLRRDVANIHGVYLVVDLGSLPDAKL